MSEATMTRRGLCRETGKLGFPTHRDAQAELRNCAFQRRYLGRVYRQERSAYLCEHCDRWHLTSQERKP